MYKLTNGGVIRLSDKAYIPNSPGNRDWENYQIWLKAGNKPQEELQTIVVYNTTTKEKIEVKGPIPEGYTDQVPREFDFWDGSLWITDLQLRNKTLKARKIQEINNACEASLSVLRTEYPDSEVISWSKQEIEARKALVDPNYSTPLVDLISEARGMDRMELINKIIQKADQYAYAVGLAVGRRQFLEDQIKAVAIGEESKLDQIKY
jgi:hypothetical protein